jgi:RNA polymerase sigma-70 factor (ECF subfamily)
MATFEAHRPALLALAYRMLGDVARAEDMVQEAWIRFGRAADVDAPRAFLVTTVTRLCLNELGSARARREEARDDRLPEPVDLDETGLGAVEAIDRISMAFLVVLQRLTPSERAVLLLHEVFEFDHVEIAAFLGRSEAACRQLLRRARDNVAAERRALATSQEEHRRLVKAFVRASTAGDLTQMLALLVPDATLVVDAGPSAARLGRTRNIGRPVRGARRIASFAATLGRRRDLPGTLHECVLNGQPAIVRVWDGRPVSATLVSVAGGRIHRIFIQADAARLTHLGAAVRTVSA